MRAKEFINGFEDQHPNERPRGPEIKPTMPKGTVRVDVSDVYDWYKLGQHISDLKGLGKHDFGQGPPSAILSFGDEDLEHEYIKALMKTGLTTTDIDPVDPKQPKGMKRQKVDPTYNVGETVIDADALVDVFIRGKHKGQTMTKLVARDFPNRSIPMLIKALEKKHGINPKAVVYGPSSKQDIEENFADGKVKGKSRPGRVKRAGASCDGSVTDLRKRAKNASGEKAKMYHWCANMKSGRGK